MIVLTDTWMNGLYYIDAGGVNVLVILLRSLLAVMVALPLGFVFFLLCRDTHTNIGWYVAGIVPGAAFLIALNIQAIIYLLR